tara:strand:+ start:80 stop:406 length:327 start_codon:yes stop_codon:yes gene_type:complete
MIVRVYETAKLDLETIGDMLWQADSQANFHPEARWIHSSSFGTEEPPTERLFREFSIKWIGREAIIMWLTSNQILYEVISYEILPEEQEALDQSFEAREFADNLKHLN